MTVCPVVCLRGHQHANAFLTQKPTVDIISSLEEVAADVSVSGPPPRPPHATAFGLMSGVTTSQSLGVLATVFTQGFLGASDIQKLSHPTSVPFHNPWELKEERFLF